MPEGSKALYLRPEQLRVGLYIHLDLSWVEHPFPLSSFRIKNEQQIVELRRLGLKQFRYSPERSTCEPDPAQEAAPDAAPPVEEPAPATRQPLEAKREQVERLKSRRAKVSGCERDFAEVTHALRGIARNAHARPEATHTEARAVIERMTGSLLTDKDVAVNLMPERIMGEEMYLHALNVTVLSLMLARELNAPREAIVELGIGALFHDIGKIDVPDRIRLKTDPLTRAETALMQEHVAFGVQVGKRMQLKPEALTVIAQHHETIDGGGYPQGLRGEKISLLSKIVSIANTYDNLCNPVNPARAITPHEALSLMYAQLRERFEPGPMSVFIRCLGVYPPGTIVVLGNDAFGMVVSVNSSRPLRPVVQVYDPGSPPEEPILVDLERETDLVISRTIKPAQLPRNIHEYLAPRKRISYYFDASGEAAAAPSPEAE